MAIFILFSNVKENKIFPLEEIDRIISCIINLGVQRIDDILYILERAVREKTAAKDALVVAKIYFILDDIHTKGLKWTIRIDGDEFKSKWKRDISVELIAIVDDRDQAFSFGKFSMESFQALKQYVAMYDETYSRFLRDELDKLDPFD